MRIKKIIETLCYILLKLNRADKIKLVKLIYLADKYHLIRYGRTITGDDYYALPHGPVASNVLDILNKNSATLKNDLSFACALLQEEDQYNFIPGAECASHDFEMLSETDMEALNFITEKFGDWDQWDLKDYTHKYPEWNQHEETIVSGSSRSIKIESEELLSILENDCLAMPPEHIKESHRILTGMYD